MENTKTYNRGDLVKLKSGSPVMTVVKQSDTVVICTWYNYTENEFKRHEFYIDLLDEYLKPQSDS